MKQFTNHVFVWRAQFTKNDELPAESELERWGGSWHLGGRRDARGVAGAGSLPRRPQLARPAEALAGIAWLPAGGGAEANALAWCLTSACY